MAENDGALRLRPCGGMRGGVCYTIRRGWRRPENGWAMPVILGGFAPGRLTWEASEGNIASAEIGFIGTEMCLESTAQTCRGER